MPKVQIVFSTDENYFPLAKGLVLSIQRAGAMRPKFELACVDTGCKPASLQWFGEQGVRVVPFDARLLGPLAQLVPDANRAMILRPFLPLIFPEATAIVWLDSDLWIQSADVLTLFGALATSNAEKLFICPEWHYSYLEFNKRFVVHQIEHAEAIYSAFYGQDVAKAMCARPTLNSGIFSMASSNPLWELWRRELHSLYSRNYGAGDAAMRHLAEQTALNLLAVRGDFAVPIDPLFNYVCLWSLPFRDAAGTVRVPLPPNSPVAVVHLVQWKFQRQTYWNHGLLYDSGKYLTEQETLALLS